MAFTTHRGDVHIMLGDSTMDGSATTSWWTTPTGNSGFFKDQLQAQVAALPTLTRASRIVGTNTGRIVSGSSRQGTAASLLVFNNSGVAGSTTASTIAAFAARVTNKGGNFVWVTLGINDILTSVPRATFAANYVTILSMIHTALPLASIFCTRIPCHGEAWAVGPVWNNADDTTIDNFNTDIATAVAGSVNPALVVDFRDNLLAWEVVNNPGKGSSGFATSDDHHWNDAGRLAAAPWALSAITVAP